MTAKNPLPLLVCYTQDAEGHLSVSTQKLCKDGKPKKGVNTHTIKLDPAGKPLIDAETGSKIVKDLQKRCIHHHGQPQIVDILDAALQNAGFFGVENDIKCTLDVLDGAKDCEYETGIFELAHRQGISGSLRSSAENDSVALCEVYTKIFTAYIRHVKEDVFAGGLEAARCWEKSLSPDEQFEIAKLRTAETLPEGWTLQEAQSLWLMHSAGSSLSDLSHMVGQPEAVLESICALFKPPTEIAA